MTSVLGEREPEIGARPDTVRVAVVGCGAIARQWHLPVLAGHERVRVAALADRDLARAKQLAGAYGLTCAVEDASELHPDMVDAAIVATPPFHHAKCSIDLMRRGIHVLVEKPMATNHRDAVAMVQAAEEAGVVLCVGVFRRLYPSVRLLRGMLDSQWLGAPIRFEAKWGEVYDWAAVTLANMQKELAGGGALIDFGSHLLDLLFYLFDGPARVLEYRDNCLGGIESDCELRLQLARGSRPVPGTVELSRTRKLGGFIRVTCERGTLQFRCNERYQIQVTAHDLKLEDPLRGEPRPCTLDARWAADPESSWYESCRAGIDDWVEAIRCGRPPQLSGRSALATVELIEQCYRVRQPLQEPWASVGLLNGDARRETAATQSSGFSVQGSTPKTRRVLVTGGTGFIGCRVVEALCGGGDWDVRALVHNPNHASRLARLPTEMVHADVDCEADVRRLVEGCDAVVHCAMGTDWGQRRNIFRVNVDGTRKLAEAAMQAGVRRFIHFSTISVHGDDWKVEGVIDESTPVRPAKGNDYAESKAEADRVIARLAQSGLCATILRPARVYGPFSRVFVVRPIEALAESRFRFVGSPDVPCNMVYVDNVVEAVIRTLEAPDAAVRGEVFTIGEPDDVSWRDFYGYFAQELGLELPNGAGDAPSSNGNRTNQNGRWWSPMAWFRGMKCVATSQEFRSLGRKILETDPIGSGPRWTLRRWPGIERTLRRWVKADDSVPIYQRSEPRASDRVELGSRGATVSIAKAQRILGYQPAVPRDRAMELTLEWIRYSGLTGD